MQKPILPDFMDAIGFDNHHINVERAHDVTKEQAISYIRNAVVHIRRNNGAYINYYSAKGASYVMAEKNVFVQQFMRPNTRRMS